MNSFLKNILTGPGYIPSHRDFKYAKLRGQFALIVFLVGVFYITLDSINGVKPFIPWYAALMGLASLALYFNRKKAYATSTILLLLLINFIVYLFSDVDIPQGGVFFYFMTCSITGLILGGYYSRSMGFFFAFLPIALGIFAYLYDTKIMPPPSYEPMMVQINFVANIVIGILSNIFIVYFLISRNQESEQSLRDKEQHSIAIANEISEKNIQLAKTNEELDRFVYSASHDMRAPLSSLLGLINLCEKTTDPQELKVYYDLMKGRINTMDGFIREITDYSRNSRMGVTLETINVRDVIEDSIQNLSYIDVYQKIRVDITPSCSIQLRTDPTRFKVIVNNLIANAYRYHRYNQQDPYIQFSVVQKDGYCHITIRDNGWGIAPEHQQRIFEMFYRASEISEGSGLGLYIVKETLDKLGGSISVDSSLGVGTAFTFSLPI